MESQADIVRRLRQRDETAVADLANTYGAKIFHLAFRCTQSREDAEEVTQDVLLRVFQRIDTFRGEAALSSWIHRIAFNEAMSRVRGRRADRTFVPVDELKSFTSDGRHASPIADWSPHAEDQVLRRELQSVLRRSIEELPPGYRAVVALRDVEGLSNEEAAAILGLTVQALKSRLHRARLALRWRLSAFVAGRHEPNAPNRPVPRVQIR